MPPDGRHAYVTSPESGTLTVIDTAAASVARRIEVKGGPLGVAVHPSGAPVYVADWYDHRLSVVDPRDGRIVAEVATGLSPSGVAVSPDGKLVVTADRDSNRISVFETGGMSLVGTVAVGERPFGVEFSPDGRRLHVANVVSNDVSVVDVASLTILASVPVGDRPYATATASGQVFATDQHGATVSVFDAETFAPTGTVDVGEYPEGIAAAGDGRALYVVNWFDNTLMKIDAVTLQRVGEVTVGDGPRAFGKFVAYDGGQGRSE